MKHENVDEVAKPTDRALWQSATHFEFAGPPDCEVGVLCRTMGTRYLSKAQATRLRLCVERPLTFSAPGGDGCRHRLVPIGRRVAEAFGLQAASEDELAMVMRRLGYTEDDGAEHGWGVARSPSVRLNGGHGQADER